MLACVISSYDGSNSLNNSLTTGFPHIMKRYFVRAAAALAVVAGFTSGVVASVDNVAPQAEAQDATGSLDLVQSLIPLISQVPLSSQLPSPVPAPRQYTVNGTQRSAYVDIPLNSADKELPIIFMFGGWQGDALETRGFSNFPRTPAGTEAIVVYPQGIDLAWEGAPYATTKRGQDVAFVREIVRALGAERSVDKDRVYAVGLSNGGGMALNLACQAPDLVDAVVSVAGAHYDPTITNCAPGAVRTMIIHGDKDDVIDYNGGERHGAHYFSAEETLRITSQRNGCDVAGSRYLLRQGNIEERYYKGCAAETKLWKVVGGIHTWYPSNPDAAQVSWDFFNAG